MRRICNTGVGVGIGVAVTGVRALVGGLAGDVLKLFPLKYGRVAGTVYQFDSGACVVVAFVAGVCVVVVVAGGCVVVVAARVCVVTADAAVVVCFSVTVADITSESRGGEVVAEFESEDDANAEDDFDDVVDDDVDVPALFPLPSVLNLAIVAEYPPFPKMPTKSPLSKEA